MSNGDTITNNKVKTENVIHNDPSESHHEKIDVEEQEYVPHFHSKTWMVVFAVSLIYAAHVINLVGLGTHGRDIVAVIGGAQKSSWLIGAVVIMVVVFGPPFSQAADFWGRRWFLIVPTFCGGIGSIIMSRATSMDMALAGQCIVGISYGAQPLLHAVASEVLTHRNRVAGQAAVNAGSGLGGVAGLLIGAALMGNGNPSGFRSYWYMTATIYLVATVVTVVFYTPPLRKLQTELSFKEKINRLDWIGYALLGSGLVLFMMALFWAQNPCEWSTAMKLPSP
jgi:MFS family permease